MLKVKDILEKKGYDMYYIKPEQTVYEALEMLADKEIGALMVVENNKLTGIFSERDYARKIILKGQLSHESKVGDVMTKYPVTVKPTANIVLCMELMTNNRIRHLPVVDNEKLIGMVTIGDIVSTIIYLQKNKINDLENYITGSGYGCNP